MSHECENMHPPSLLFGEKLGAHRGRPGASRLAAARCGESMNVQALETDYLVVGAGAMGMAFADEILTQNPHDQVILVDKHARPGGHWNDAYPFVSLHQPAAFFGVNFENLGPGSIGSSSPVFAGMSDIGSYVK